MIQDIKPTATTYYIAHDADASRCVTVPPADDAKWQPVWDAGSISPKP
jgi:hypothetical protein